MNPTSVPESAKKLSELLLGAVSSYPEFAVWAAILESPLSEKARAEIEELLSGVFEEGIGNISVERMSQVMESLSSILERERQEAVVERREVETLLLRFFSHA